jgi:hypothetical protein
MAAIFAPMTYLIKKKIGQSGVVLGACLHDIETRLKASLEVLYNAPVARTTLAGQRTMELADVGVLDDPADPAHAAVKGRIPIPLRKIGGKRSADLRALRVPFHIGILASRRVSREDCHHVSCLTESGRALRPG